MAKILVLNGPNLNLLGQREPDHYGNHTLESINARLKIITHESGHSFDTFQTNNESLLVERIHQAMDEEVDWIIINPAAFTHTSVSIRDALAAVKIPFIEVHLSNVHAREPFRKHSYFSDISSGVISGLGAIGYELALSAILRKLED